MNVTQLEAEITRLQREVGRLKLKEQAKANRFDRLPDDTVLLFDRRFTDTSEPYTYAALKKKGNWYLTNTGGVAATDFNKFVSDVESFKIAEFKPFTYNLAEGGVVTSPWTSDYNNRIDRQFNKPSAW